MNTQLIQKPGDLLKYLERSKSSIAMALPKHLTPERMMRLALTAFSTTPALRKCTPQSILSSVVVASQIGLEIGIAGQGYLIPYKDTATFVPGWQGLVGLLNNTGRATAWTGAVFEGDEFEFELGSSPKCRHVPGENFGDPDKMAWVYACGKVNGSEQPVIEAWPIKRVWSHRDKFNKVGAKHYSFIHPEMYARKVLLLQVLKYMPRSIELNNAIAASDAAEVGKATKVDDGVVVEVDAEDVRSAPSGKEPYDPFKGRKAIAEKPAPEPKPEPETASAYQDLTDAPEIPWDGPAETESETLL
jgi:recombination protein RecT